MDKKNLQQLQQRYERLTKQQDGATTRLMELVKQHNLKYEDVLGIIPPVPDVLVKHSKTIRQMEDRRRRQMASLPDELKAAVKRFNEIGELFTSIRHRLAIYLCDSGYSIVAIAKRMAITKDDAKSLILSAHDEDFVE